MAGQVPPYAVRPPAALLELFEVTSPEFVTETAIARVWRVRRGRGLAALKVWHDPGMANEAGGVEYLSIRRQHGAVRLFARAEGAVLMEWLDGPSLGDLVRAGRDGEATGLLAQVASRLWRQPTVWPGARVVSEEDWCRALFALEFGPALGAEDRAAVERARGLMRRLMEGAGDHIALHGDLHHDNVKDGPRGWTAFDAKGIVGPRAFDLANAFRNPKGAEALIADPARARALAAVFAPAAGVSEAEMLGWAAAKVALSISWRAQGRLDADGELGLLRMFLELAGA
ncbi:streptomycin resistance protein [Oceanicola sp. D3]|uniref:aminoglycoside phosphotransferase family protein n=1 Tax=Oceanicola sp. D3 TaxID=2587163 RepID=UPI00111EE5A6|nr:aminoglycoside phosphotransferase family protein [Oceanicola sp. D3]QDC09478.1 streptomycin resistance protein [Oceanicola sp. D3]